jgi:hypothetical protein
MNVPNVFLPAPLSRNLTISFMLRHMLGSVPIDANIAIYPATTLFGKFVGPL